MVALALSGSSYKGWDVAHAQGTVNFDVDPEVTGNSANTLGTVENCYAVTCPSAECSWDGSSSFDDVSDYNIDIVVFGDTQAPTAYDALLNYDSTKVHIAGPGTDDLIKMPGGLGYGDGLPDSDGTFAAGAMFFAGYGTAGDGTIVRVGLDIGASGVVTFTLNPYPFSRYASGAGDHPITLDGGRLAINEACADVVGGIAELPDVSDSSGRSHAALAAGVAAGVVALGAGTWYAKRRWLG